MPTHTAGRGRRPNALFRGAPRIRRPFDRYGASNARFFMGFGFQAEAWETLDAALREHGQQREVTLTKETGLWTAFRSGGRTGRPGRSPAPGENRLAAGCRRGCTAAQLLCAAGNWLLAQAILLARAKEFDITLGTQLEPLAKEAETRGYPLMSVIIWRALLNPILERGASKAYYHAAQYLSELRRLAGTIDDHRGLPTHAEYEARLRERHGRKTGFWRQMSIRP